MDELAQQFYRSTQAQLSPNVGSEYYRTANGNLYQINDTVAQLVQKTTQQPEDEQPSDDEIRMRAQAMFAPSTEGVLVDVGRETAAEPRETITEKSLVLDNNFIRAASQVHELFEGEPFTGTADDAVQYGMDVMGEFTFNFFGVPGYQPAGTAGGDFTGGGMIAQAATIVNSGTPEQAQSFLYMLEQYEKLPTFTQAGMGRMFRGLMNDPATAGSIALAGTPQIFKMIGQRGAAMTTRKMLQTIAANPGKAGMVPGAVYGAGGEGTTMAVEEASGREISPEERALRYGIGTAVGGTVGGTLGKAVPVLGEIAKDIGAPAVSAVADTVEAAGQSAKARMAEGGTTLTSGVDPDPLIAAAGDAVKAMRSGSQQSHPARISTRQPSDAAVSKDPLLDPIENQLVIGLDEAKASGEKAFNANVQQFQKSVNMTNEEAQLNPDEAAERFIEHIKNNLLWLHDKVPAKTRERSRLWYDGARALTDRWSEEYGIPDASIAGILAALSPQKDWYQNVNLGQRVIEILNNKTDVPFDDKMAAKASEVFPKKAGIINLLKGKTLNDLDTTAEKALWLRFYDEVYNSKDFNILTPEGDFGPKVLNDDGSPADMAWGTMNSIEKAINSFYSNGDRATLSKLMGERHKVRNFYNNILDPNGIYGDVTIDTHAVAAGLLRPLSASSYDVFRAFGTAPTKEQQAKFNLREGEEWVAAKSSAVTGQRGTYAFYAEAYRRAAAERNLLPRQMQSITWEAVRGLFSADFKGQEKNVKMIKGIWEQYRNGTKSIDDVRNEIEKAANYIDPPTWE